MNDFLTRPLLLPDATSFTEVLEYLDEWDYERDRGMTDPAVTHIGKNEVSEFCTVNLSQVGGPKHRNIKVKPTRAVLDAVAPKIVTPDDRLSFKIVAHKETGKALVILEHGYIIGSHWLAYIDPSTIPAAS